SGLGLFLWRWWRSTPGRPTQAGHWLLIFGGLGLGIDLLSTNLMKLALHYSGTGLDITHFGAWLFHQASVWWLAAVIATIVLARLHDAGPWWSAMTVATVVVLTLNSIVATI